MMIMCKTFENEYGLAVFCNNNGITKDMIVQITYNSRGYYTYTLFYEIWCGM